MAIFFIWIFLSIVAGVIASKKGRSGWGFFWLSIFLSPLVGIVCAALASPDRVKMEKAQLSDPSYRQCPYCKEVIRRDASRCRHCHADIGVKIEQKSHTDFSSATTNASGERVEPVLPHN